MHLCGKNNNRKNPKTTQQLNTNTNHSFREHKENTIITQMTVS